MSQEKLLITHKPLATQNNCVSAESYQNLIRSGGQNRKNVGISALFSLFGLFPLNRSCGLGGEVIEDAVDAFDLGGDTADDTV